MILGISDQWNLPKYQKILFFMFVLTCNQNEIKGANQYSFCKQTKKFIPTWSTRIIWSSNEKVCTIELTEVINLDFQFCSYFKEQEEKRYGEVWFKLLQVQVDYRPRRFSYEETERVRSVVGWKGNKKEGRLSSYNK